MAVPAAPSGLQRSSWRGGGHGEGVRSGAARVAGVDRDSYEAAGVVGSSLVTGDVSVSRGSVSHVFALVKGEAGALAGA
jgi:hypothetical protein